MLQVLSVKTLQLAYMSQHTCQLLTPYIIVLDGKHGEPGVAQRSTAQQQSQSLLSQHSLLGSFDLQQTALNQMGVEAAERDTMCLLQGTKRG